MEPHNLYLNLNNNEEARQVAYRDLFQTYIDKKTLKDIRQATQKGWALGNERFKDKIEKLLQRRARPLS